MKDEGATFWRCQNLWKDLRQGLPFQIDVRAGIAHRRVQAGMTEPLADRGKVNSCLEKMNRRRMAKRMRMNSLVGQCRHRLRAGIDVFSQEISHAESRH